MDLGKGIAFETDEQLIQLRGFQLQGTHRLEDFTVFLLSFFAFQGCQFFLQALDALLNLFFFFSELAQVHGFLLSQSN